MRSLLTPKKILIVFLAFSVGILIPIALNFFYQTLKKNISTSSKQKTTTNAGETQNPSNTINILFIGHGGAGHSGGSLADTIILVNADKQTKSVKLISIPRDTWVKIPTQSDKSEYHKINYAYAIGSDDQAYPLKEPQYKGANGGGNLTKKMVEEVTGFPADYYISIDFNGFQEAIDILGGIDVNIPVTFDDYFYPIAGEENNSCGKTPQEIDQLTKTLSGFELEKQFECRYEHLHFDQGLNHLDGTTTLKFVRSRHSDQHGGDFARSLRQFAVLEAIKNKLLGTGGIDNTIPFFDKFKDIIKTDLNEDIIKNLTDFIGNPKLYSISNMQLSNQNVLNETTSSDGQYILIPKAGVDNWQEVHNFIKSEL